ncbi:protein SIEVE ELEMENT OCCLUSION C-like [Corylus avellana]|uniref:protein SIEVE ELEMENT OCCLUSION C-like n=1 Tax=Corylus avellana TaxID=13451 RepID=UPI001E21F1B8|nr:protein SIEVE ELEMENT OCCLUSION C-like [Corylus avellana]XP_059460795.1 protein SIEVE ELEMENT OCCLUSION C-like [Corylus avellana]
MASDEILPISAQQPSEGNQLHEIVDLISATHIVPADEKIDVDSLFIVVKNILRRSTQIVDNVLQGNEPLENLEEKVSRASFDPLLCTLKQLSSEMACEALGEEIVHKTTMSILNKLSSYSWDAKAILTLAAFALDYEEYFLALVELHSSNQLVESVEIPKHEPATLKLSDLQKHKKTIDEFTKMINDMLAIMEIIFEVKNLFNNDIEEGRAASILHAPELVYWIIITVVACTTQMCCLKSDKDKTQELLPFAKNISGTCEKLMVTIELSGLEKAGYRFNRQQKRWAPQEQSPNEKLKRMRMRNHMMVIEPRGPYAIEEYTFFCGGKDNKWIEQFSKKVNVVAEDPITKEAYIFIELSCVGESRKQLQFWKYTETRKKTEIFDFGNQEIQKLLLSFKNESRWAVLTKGSTRVVSDHGMTIMKVLEAFEEWKVNVRERGFEICFKEYYNKFLQSGLLPSTS